MRTKSIVTYLSPSEKLKKINRTRTTNFTPADRLNLLELIQPFADILSNKNTDKSTCTRKQEAWHKITIDYNSKTSIIRTVTQLKLCFEAIKYKERRKASSPKNTVETSADNTVAVATDFIKTEFDVDQHREETDDGNNGVSPNCSVTSSIRSSLSMDAVSNVPFKKTACI